MFNDRTMVTLVDIDTQQSIVTYTVEASTSYRIRAPAGRVAALRSLCWAAPPAPCRSQRSEKHLWSTNFPHLHNKNQLHNSPLSGKCLSKLFILGKSKDTNSTKNPWQSFGKYRTFWSASLHYSPTSAATLSLTLLSLCSSLNTNR